MPWRDLRDESDDDDDEEEIRIGDDDDDDGGDGGGDDDDDGGDSGDGGGDFDGGDQGDQGGDSGDQGGGDFDWGDSGDQGDQGDSGWSAVQDYEDSGRTIRKFTDATGTDYFQDVGEWSQPGEQDSGFDWGDGSRQREYGQQDYGPPPDVDPDIRDLHDYYHPYTISKFENDPIRVQWDSGVASDGTRFDQQDQGTQDMFRGSYGDEQAARSWAEQRSRDLHAEFQQYGTVTLPQRPEQAPSSVLNLPRGTSLFGQEPTPEEQQAGAAAQEVANQAELARQQAQAPATAPAPIAQPGQSPLETAIPPYTPPAVESPTPAPEPEAAPPQPRAPATPPVAVHPAVQAAADAVARAGGTPDQVAQAAVQAAAAADQSRSLAGESMDTQIRFRGLYGGAADATWQQQHAQELAVNKGLYGSEEPAAGTPSSIPGIGPATDRRLTAPGGAQPAAWNRPPATATPGAAGPAVGSPGGPPGTGWTGTIEPGRPNPGLAPSAVSAVTNTTRGAIADVLNPPSNVWPTPPSAIYNGSAAPAEVPNPNTGAVRGPTAVPPPLTAAQAAAYERGGVNPATGDIDVQATPIGPGGEQAEDILTIRNGLGQVRQEPRWAWDQRGPQGQQVWEVVNAEGRPTQSMREAGYSPASAQIDTSIRSAAGLPPVSDPTGADADYRDPRLADPFSYITAREARAQGANDLQGFQRSVAAGIAKGEAWARPYADELARIAWYRESRGMEGGPENAPTSYLEDWKGALRGADFRVPGIRETSQRLIDNGATLTRPGAPFNWKEAYGPTGENGLISRQSTGIDCGPNAFVNILRSQGYNADPARAFTFAKDQGYHNGVQFTGPDSFARMLRDEAGLDARATPVDWNAVDRELAEGRLVTLSSPGHYWTISAKDEQGRYYAGATAQVVGNAPSAGPNAGWVTGRGGFAYGGRPNAMITYSGQVNPSARGVRALGLKPPTTASPPPGRVSMSENGEWSPDTPARSDGAVAQTSIGRSGGDTYSAMTTLRNQINPNAPETLRAASPPDPALTPTWFTEANPDDGTTVGQGRARDVGARLWNNAYQMSDGDATFADVIAGIVNGEGGFSGNKDQYGATGLFQFDPRHGEYKNFQSWLRENRPGMTVEQAGADVDIASDYYVSKLYKSYQRARAAGVSRPEDLTIQTMVYQWDPKNEPGGAHNAGVDASPRLQQNYIQGYREFKDGVFRLTPKSRW